MRVLFINVVDSRFTSKLHLDYDSALGSGVELTSAKISSYQSQADVIELTLFEKSKINFPIHHVVLSGADLIYIFFDKSLYYVSKRTHKVN
jgi:hypothetical protein